MTETEKQSVITATDASMRLEGMPLTETEKQTIKDCLDEKLTFDEAVQNIVNEYRRC